MTQRQELLENRRKERKTASRITLYFKAMAEYYQECYNYNIKYDNSIIINQLPEKVNELQILKLEFEDATQKLKYCKSPDIDNIPYALLKFGGDEIINIFTELCQISWSRQWKESLIVPITKKKGNLRK